MMPIEMGTSSAQFSCQILITTRHDKGDTICWDYHRCGCVQLLENKDTSFDNRSTRREGSGIKSLFILLQVKEVLDGLN